MADGIVGKPVIHQFRTGLAGQTFTLAAGTTKPDGSSWEPEIANVDGDLYTLTFTPDQDGVWLAELDDAANAERYGAQFEILAGPSVTFARVTDGQIRQPGHINRLQQRLEELPF